jgi:hypothetical protein
MRGKAGPLVARKHVVRETVVGGKIEVRLHIGLEHLGVLRALRQWLAVGLRNTFSQAPSIFPLWYSLIQAGL